MPAVTSPTLQLLAWIAERDRTYAQTMEAWKSSMPTSDRMGRRGRRGLVRIQRGTVLLTAAGTELLSVRSLAHFVGVRRSSYLRSMIEHEDASLVAECYWPGVWPRTTAISTEGCGKPSQTSRVAGYTSAAERTRTELQRVATRQAPATLTPTERQIAQLAADGLTNKGIAARMFVSAKTVEANLSRVYRKLGISARTQLGRALAKAQE